MNSSREVKYYPKNEYEKISDTRPYPEAKRAEWARKHTLKLFCGSDFYTYDTLPDYAKDYLIVGTFEELFSGTPKRVYLLASESEIKEYNIGQDVK